jgi:glutaredoxin 3
MYVTNWCPYCTQAKRLLESIDVEWDEINIEQQGMSREELSKITGGHTVPQIVIGDTPVGGYTELWALQQSGKLAELLAA